jgi:hypothetical protein
MCYSERCQTPRRQDKLATFISIDILSKRNQTAGRGGWSDHHEGIAAGVRGGVLIWTLVNAIDGTRTEVIAPLEGRSDAPGMRSGRVRVKPT